MGQTRRIRRKTAYNSTAPFQKKTVQDAPEDCPAVQKTPDATKKTGTRRRHDMSGKGKIVPRDISGELEILNDSRLMKEIMESRKDAEAGRLVPWKATRDQM